MDRKPLTEEDVARHWSDNAGDWRASVRFGYDAFRRLFNLPAFAAFVGDTRGQRVLDAGCGEGELTRLLAGDGARVVGVDLARGMLDLAREDETLVPLGIEYILGSFTCLSSIGLCEFDHVVSFMALMDGPHLEDALAAFHAALKPGGVFSFAVLHPCFYTPALGWWDGPYGPQLQVARYFDEEPRLQAWTPVQGPSEIPPFTVPRFPRTIATYLNALTEAGFRLSRVQEPRPSLEACAAFPSLRAWREHASLFLYVRATRE